MKLHVRNTQKEDLESFEMLPEDVDEVLSASGRTPKEALERAVALSSRSYSVFVNGVLCLIFGVGHYDNPQRGTVWLLRTVNHEMLSKRDHLMLSQQCWGWLTEGYSILENMVPSKNIKTLSWLKHLGFSFGSTIVLNGVSFTHFYKSI